jgi:hypothetical protein
VKQHSIHIRTAFVGMHCWPSAPPSRSYLRTPHRHTFNVRVELEVRALDREVEFHDLKDAVDATRPPAEQVMALDGANPFLHFSCEHHAERIMTLIGVRYPSRRLSVTVDEDGECGATVESSP